MHAHTACRYTLKPGHKTENNNPHPYPLDNGSELKMNVIVEHMHIVYTPISVLIPLLCCLSVTVCPLMRINPKAPRM